MPDDLLPFTAVPESCGFFTALDAGGNPQQYYATRAECHEMFGLEMDCALCVGEAGTGHTYEEPMFTDLTDCVDGCVGAVTHERPCPT